MHSAKDMSGLMKIGGDSYHIANYIVQKFDGGNFEKFDKGERFVKVFPSCYPFPLNISPIRPSYNLLVKLVRYVVS